MVETLAESWVPQLATRPAASPTGDRAQYAGAVLLHSSGWNYDGDYWVTVMNTPFPSAQDANAWCDTHRFAAQDCFAKKLSHSGPVDGSARYRG